jgi:glycosyltransferase involved in cell wall biosynthesis
VLRKLERYVYDKSDGVTTIDKVFYETIVERFKDKSKLYIIPNFVDTDLYKPLNADSVLLEKSLFPQSDSLKLLYAGNIGFAQDWEPLVELVRKTKDDNIEYFVIGEGVMKQYIVDKKNQYNLDKLHIISYQPRNLIPQIISYSDIQFIFMHPEMDKQGFPSKVYTIMACAKPLLVCSGEDTPIVNFLNGLDCAKLVTTHNLNDKVEQLYGWLQQISREQLREMGENGLAVISKSYTKQIVTKQYASLVDKLIN